MGIMIKIKAWEHAYGICWRLLNPPKTRPDFRRSSSQRRKFAENHIFEIESRVFVPAERCVEEFQKFFVFSSRQRQSCQYQGLSRRLRLDRNFRGGWQAFAHNLVLDLAGILRRYALTRSRLLPGSSLRRPQTRRAGIGGMRITEIELKVHDDEIFPRMDYYEGHAMADLVMLALAHETLESKRKSARIGREREVGHG